VVRPAWAISWRCRRVSEVFDCPSYIPNFKYIVGSDLIVIAFLKAIDGVSEWTAKLASFLIIPLTGVMMYEVAMRYLFANPTLFAYDMSWMLYGVYGAMGLAYCHLRQGHVRVDFLYSLLSPRRKAILEAVFYVIFFFPLFYVVLRYSAENVIDSWAIRETASGSIWRPPVYPFKTLVLVGFVLLFLQGVVEFGRNLYVAIKGITPYER